MDECWEQDRSHLTARETESQRESERQRDRETERQRVRETGRQREDRSHLFCHSELCVHQNHLRHHVDVSVYYEGMAGRGESATHRHRQHHRNQRADVWNEIECKGEQPPDEKGGPQISRTQHSWMLTARGVGASNGMDMSRIPPKQDFGIHS